MEVVSTVAITISDRAYGPGSCYAEIERVVCVDAIHIVRMKDVRREKSR